MVLKIPVHNSVEIAAKHDTVYTMAAKKQRRGILGFTSSNLPIS